MELMLVIFGLSPAIFLILPALFLLPLTPFLLEASLLPFQMAKPLLRGFFVPLPLILQRSLRGRR